MPMQGSGSEHEEEQASFADQEQREPLMADELPLESDEVCSMLLPDVVCCPHHFSQVAS